MPALMTIEQTTQLIQLILNTVLMVMASGILLGVALRFQDTLQHQNHYFASEPAPLPPQNSLHVKYVETKLHLRRQLRRISRTILILTIACFTLMSSTVFLALRSLIHHNGLITFSLTLFAIGCGVLLLGIGLLFHLLLHQGRRLSSGTSAFILPVATLRSSDSPRRIKTRQPRFQTLWSSATAIRSHKTPLAPNSNARGNANGNANLLVLGDRMVR